MPPAPTTLTLLLLFTLFTLALTTPPNQPFTLLPDSTAPPPLLGKHLTINTLNARYPYLGIDNGGTLLKGYLKTHTDPSRGDVIVLGDLGAASTGMNLSLIWLRPTFSTPPYFVRVGNPAADVEMSASMWTDWRVREMEKVPVPSSGGGGNWNGNFSAVGGGYMLDYGEMAPVGEALWSACSITGGWVLYYGLMSTPRVGCTERFKMRVVFESDWKNNLRRH
ncbi:hypothetical protein EX30DRAFT_338894 [Ascodesmis nigricans]|uniref:Uncharacterized protein n=1 Tax=Ascodesmis nigricans TaxID=341454 RepID=A0A4S2N516_9PEZI|nr:hypothetical protein EX30DRAFT_338894 [Ascodesmis nigricans]